MNLVTEKFQKLFGASSHVQSQLSQVFQKMIASRYIHLARGTYPYIDPYPQLDKRSQVEITEFTTKTSDKKRKRSTSETNTINSSSNKFASSTQIETSQEPSSFLETISSENVLWEVNYSKFLLEWRNEVN